MHARTMAIVTAATAVTLACTSASAGAVTGRPGAAARGAAGACTSWRTVTAPTPPGFTTPPEYDSSALVSSVSVLSDRDVWFAGGDFAAPGSSATWWGPWMLRWNGRSVTSPPQASLVPSAWSDFSSNEPGSFDSDTDGWILMAGQNLRQFDPYIATAEHWSGGHWTPSPVAVSPDPAHKGVWPYDVAAVSPDDAWAVGAFYSTKVLFGTEAVGALIAHWDGTAWSIVPNPAQNQKGAVLEQVSVVSPDDIWAVGHQGNPNEGSNAGHLPFIEHWNGSTWSMVAAPAGSKPSFLFGVSGDSGTDAWAVGYQTEPGTSTLIPLVEHWNGTAWRAVALPASVTGLNGLIAVYAAAPDDVWATDGGAQYPLGGSGHDVFLHWDGSMWTVVPAPGPQGYGLGYLYTAIGGTGPGNIWAAGTVTPGYPGLVQYPLIARLDCGPGGR